MMKRNEWICEYDYFGGWIIEFQKFENLEQIIRLKDYMAKFLLIGKEERVLNISSSEGLQVFDVPLIPYIEQIEWLIEHKQMLEFFTYIHLNSSAFVSYFGKQGEIVDAEISDIWELYKQLNLPKYEPPQAPRSSPVGIGGTPLIKIDSNSSLERTIQAYIGLRTDIWFPKLAHPRKYAVLRYDNRELAYRHTPRLNKFLMRVRELTIQWGGRWRVMPPSVELAENYQAQLTEMGIRIP